MTDVCSASAAERVALVEIRRPPANFFDEALLTAARRRAAGPRRRREVSPAWSSARRASTSAPAPTCGAWARRASAGCIGRRSGSSPAASRSWPPSRALPSAAAWAWRWPRTSASRHRTARLTANFARLGFHQGFGLSVTLPAAVGAQRALDLLYTGRSVSATRHWRIGLCDRVAEDPRAAAIEFASQIAASAPLSLPAIRATMRRSMVSDVASALDMEANAQAALLDTADFAEGVAASVEKRSPLFTGT